MGLKSSGRGLPCTAETSRTTMQPMTDALAIGTDSVSRTGLLRRVHGSRRLLRETSRPSVLTGGSRSQILQAASGRAILPCHRPSHRALPTSRPPVPSSSPRVTMTMTRICPSGALTCLTNVLARDGIHSILLRRLHLDRHLRAVSSLHACPCIVGKDLSHPKPTSHAGR